MFRSKSTEHRSHHPRQRRRQWALPEKIRAVEESNLPGMTVSYVARKYGISPRPLFKWRKLMSEGGKQAIRADDEVVSIAEVRELKKRIQETVAFARSLGLVPCFTPVRSPESNGMAESFVKTFKRDYVYVNDRPDAATVLAQLDRWFEDYNEVHPHKGLKRKSPREFIRNQLAAGCPI